MRLLGFLFLGVFGIGPPLYAEPSCAYDLIEMQDTFVDVPPGFSLRVATPRLLIGSFARTPIGNLDILDRRTGGCVGTLGVCQSARGACYPIYLNEDSFNEPLGEQNLGRGLGTEAKYAMLVHAFGTSETDVVYARIESSNERSLRLHWRLGFKEIPFWQVPPFAIIRKLPFRTIIYLRLTRADFEAWNANRDKSPSATEEFFRLTRF